MLVSFPRGAGAVAALRGRLVLLLVALLGALAMQPASAGAAPKILSKAKVVAPQGGTVRGTLSGAKCLVRFPRIASSIRVTVRGPLSSKRPKTTKLRTKGRKRVNCTWRTTAFKDGTYTFVTRGKMKIGSRRYTVTMRRTVLVRNRSTPTSTAASGIPEGPPLGPGNARFVARLDSEWDGWFNATDTDTSRRSFIRRHFWGIQAYAPAFDRFLSWTPPTLVYKDLYAIYRGDDATLNAHPEWVLKDTAGNPLSIDWGCNPGPCPQFAGDIGSPTFRANWIAQAKAQLAAGYSGIWIDDANMEIRVGNAAGQPTIPVDPRTGQPMTFLNWRKYIAEFLAQIRRELPSAQLVANVLWFGGTSVGRDSDPYIRKAYTSVNRLNLERGFNDDGLTAGYAPRDVWSVDTFMQFIDRMHDLGLPVTLDSAGSGKEAWEYNLAGFFLVDQGADAVGEMQLPPGQWWSGWDVRLGDPLGERDRRTDGVFERKFQKGLVLLNPSRAAPRTVKLSKPWKRIDGSTVTSVTLGGGRGAVLLAP